MMEAGREMDAMVAELVMRQCAHRERVRYCIEDGNSVDSGFTCKACGVDLYANECPRYSTDIAAAWTVVEKLGLSVIRSEDGWYAIKPTDIEHERISCTDKNSIRLIGRDGEIFTPADTPAEAICRAALAASRSSRGEGGRRTSNRSTEQGEW